MASKLKFIFLQWKDINEILDQMGVGCDKRWVSRKDAKKFYSIAQRKTKKQKRFHTTGTKNYNETNENHGTTMLYCFVAPWCFPMFGCVKWLYAGCSGSISAKFAVSSASVK